MTKAYLKKLVELTYDKKQQINQAHAETIASLLKRADLKKYLNTLKRVETKRTVTISSAVPLSSQQEQDFAKEFLDKTIQYRVDPTLMVGIEVTDNDIVYNNNLKQRFTSLAQHLGE
ncbi:MAG: F0F1 ATP synthase subunit delta [Patescibacteria group bacterium]